MDSDWDRFDFSSCGLCGHKHAEVGPRQNLSSPPQCPQEVSWPIWRSWRASWGGGGWLWFTRMAMTLIAEATGNCNVIFLFVLNIFCIFLFCFTFFVFLFFVFVYYYLCFSGALSCFYSLFWFGIFFFGCFLSFFFFFLFLFLLFVLVLSVCSFIICFFSFLAHAT